MAREESGHAASTSSFSSSSSLILMARLALGARVESVGLAFVSDPWGVRCVTVFVAHGTCRGLGRHCSHTLNTERKSAHVARSEARPRAAVVCVECTRVDSYLYRRTHRETHRCAHTIMVTEVSVAAGTVGCRLAVYHTV